MIDSLLETLRMIKIEHSVFALPFALVGAFLAAQGLPEWRVLGWILVAMVSARSAAMAFNRWLDADIDARNPRTASRSIPAGRLSRVYAAGFTTASCLVFISACWQLNRLALLLSPVALLVLLGYSYTKRFTNLSHLVLGLALGISPVGAWIAVRATIEAEPLWLGAAVMLWTAGFDIIYACQDIGFDRETGLHSVPATIGVNGSLWLSRLMHLAVISILVMLGSMIEVHAIYWLGLLIVGLCLIYEHRLVWDGDMTRINMAFFTLNGVVSLVFGAVTIGAILLQG